MQQAMSREWRNFEAERCAIFADHFLLLKVHCDRLAGICIFQHPLNLVRPQHHRQLPILCHVVAEDVCKAFCNYSANAKVQQ